MAGGPITFAAATTLPSLEAIPQPNYKTPNHLSYEGASAGGAEHPAFCFQTESEMEDLSEPVPPILFFCLGPREEASCSGPVTLLQRAATRTQPLAWGARQQGGFALELSSTEAGRAGWEWGQPASWKHEMLAAWPIQVN